MAEHANIGPGPFTPREVAGLFRTSFTDDALGLDLGQRYHALMREAARKLLGDLTNWKPTGMLRPPAVSQDMMAEIRRLADQVRHDGLDEIKLTSDQFEAIKAETSKSPPMGIHPMLGTPVRIVDRVEDSTPWALGWRPTYTVVYRWEA